MVFTASLRAGSSADLMHDLYAFSPKAMLANMSSGSLAALSHSFQGSLAPSSPRTNHLIGSPDLNSTWAGLIPVPRSFSIVRW